MATVKVAVRVRPFNQREIEGECQKIIEMQGKMTKIVNTKIPEIVQGGDIGRERNKEFSFDFSHDSFDHKDAKFVSQEQVYNDLGTDVVQNAFEGYNACVFAYGQTGSGKTYTMMGSPESVGLIPRICQNLFHRMKESENAGTTYRTEVSYLEIYNEKVKDLLMPNRRNENLRVREHPRLGPYVQDLSRHLVMDYEDILEWINKGNAIRTTASTNMNDTSSRSHAIFTITFVQAKFNRDMPSETVSKVNLVDLAGSERADSSGATGQRLKEGGHINKSLVTLGSVISALADIPIGTNRSRPVFVPYRDSVLTWLLKDSLGGNSKTIMIAAISPADVNYGETLSTLRYANRAKNIVNKPTINEDSNVKLIRELRAEIGKLKNLLSSTTQNGNSSLLVELRENEKKVKELTEEWTERWRETKKILEEQTTLALRKSGVGVVLDSAMPHLVGIDDSIYSSGMTFYPLKDGSTYLGTESALPKPDIVIGEVSDMSPNPCSIELNNGKALLNPLQNNSCYILIDNDTLLVDEPTQLTHGCVITIGRNMFRYNDPPQAAKLRKEKSNGSNHNLSRLSFLSQSSPDLRRSLKTSSNVSAGQHKDLSGRSNDVSDNNDTNLSQQRGRSNSKSKRQRLHSDNVSNNSKEDFHLQDLPNDPSRISEKNQNLFSCDKNNSTNSTDQSNSKPVAMIDMELPTTPNKSTFDVAETNFSPESESTFQIAMQRSNSITSTPTSADPGNALRKCKSEFNVAATKDAGVNCRLNTFEDDDDIDGSNVLTAPKLRCIQQYLENMFMDCGDDDHHQKLEKLKRHFSRIEEEMENSRHNNLSSGINAEMNSAESANSTLNVNRFYKSSLSMPGGFERVQLNDDADDPEFDRASARSFFSNCSTPTIRSSFSFDGPNMDVLEEYEIAVSVPSFILRGSSATAHFEYEIKMTCRNETWSIYRRYQRFQDLHKQMTQKYRSMMRPLRLPPRWWYWQCSEELAEERRQRLQIYLRDLLAKCLSTKECLLFAYADTLDRQSLCEFIPFFRKGDFESTKFGTC